MEHPKVEVETESAGRYSDVDLETLHRLVSRLSEDNSYLIVHRPDKPEEFAQAAFARRPNAEMIKDAFVVEYRDAAGQYQANTKDLGRVRDALAGWAFSLPGWRNDFEWSRLEF